MKQLSLTTNQEHIVDMLIRKNPKLDRGILETAVAFIADAHEGQYRKSGMPYTEHPYEVAKILADLKQDQPTVLAGLLHDVVEDTDMTFDEFLANASDEASREDVLIFPGGMPGSRNLAGTEELMRIMKVKLMISLRYH